MAIGATVTGGAVVATLPKETSAAVEGSLNVADVQKEIGPDESVTGATLTIMGDASYQADVVPDEYVVSLTVDETEIDSVRNDLSDTESEVGYELQGDLLETELTAAQLTPDDGSVTNSISITVTFTLLYNGSTMAKDTITTDATVNIQQETVTANIDNSANGSINVQAS